MRPFLREGTDLCLEATYSILPRYVEETKCLVFYHVIEQTTWESDLDYICSFKNNSLEAYVTNVCTPAALRRVLSSVASVPRLWSQRKQGGS